MLSWSACSCWKNNYQSVQRTDSAASRHSWQADSVRLEHSRFVLIRGDTVLIRDTIFRDRLHTLTRSDTIYQKQEVYVEKPVRYVPRFYKACATLLGLILLAIGWWCIWKIRNRRSQGNRIKILSTN